MYRKTYEYYVNPTKRLFCSDAQGTPIGDLPTFYFGERPVFTIAFEDGVLVEGEKLVFVMDNENRFLDSHSTTGLAPVMAWCIHEITAEDVTNKSIDLELYCFGKKYADVINGHDNSVTCILSLFIKSIDGNLNCTFSTLATTLAYAEPTIVSPDCVFDELPIDMYLTRDEMNALIAEVEAIQREAIEKAEQARQSAAVAESAAQEASQIAKDLKPIVLSSPPTTSTVGSVGQLAVYHDSDSNKDHLYHLCFVSEGNSATLYHWEECVLINSNGKISRDILPLAASGGVNDKSKGAVGNAYPFASQRAYSGINIQNGNIAVINSIETEINSRKGATVITPINLEYAVRSVCKNITEIPAATSDYSLVDSSATTNNHSHVYSHAPTTAPTYRLPQVTNTTIAHYIELTVDFTAVQTYSFLDNTGEPIVPLFTPAITAGDVYTFKMEYSAIKGSWLIYPQKQGAVADDFVMRGEVGAANGVAGLDASAKVPLNQLPMASAAQYGVVKLGNGLKLNTANLLVISAATHAVINNRSSQYAPISAYDLNWAVTAALTDANHITLNDAQKATAQSVFGVVGPITAIPAATSEYTLSYGRFSHVPELASTYVLPAVADGGIANDITLMVEFSSTVLTYEFQDSAGNTLVPLPLNGDIEAGSVVTFLCRYNPLLSQWVIYPIMDGKEAQA